MGLKVCLSTGKISLKGCVFVGLRVVPYSKVGQVGCRVQVEHSGPWGLPVDQVSVPARSPSTTLSFAGPRHRV